MPLDWLASKWQMVPTSSNPTFYMITLYWYLVEATTLHLQFWKLCLIWKPISGRLVRFLDGFNVMWSSNNYITNPLGVGLLFIDGLNKSSFGWYSYLGEKKWCLLSWCIEDVVICKFGQKQMCRLMIILLKDDVAS